MNILNDEVLYVPKGNHTSVKNIQIKIERIKNNINNFFVVADFDKTITAGNSLTVRSILARSGIIGPEYTKKRDELFHYYRPYEISKTISDEEKNNKMNEWRTKHLSLLVEYKVSESQILETAKEYMNWRPGAMEFFELLKKHNIPIIFISAGIGNFIKALFEISNIDMDNISVESNFLLYDSTGTVSGLDKEHIIQPFNKNKHTLNDRSTRLVGYRKNALLLGDGIGDINMIDLFSVDNYLSCGLLTEETKKEHFDNSGFDLVNLSDSLYPVNEFLSL